MTLPADPAEWEAFLTAVEGLMVGVGLMRAAGHTPGLGYWLNDRTLSVDCARCRVAFVHAERDRTFGWDCYLTEGIIPCVAEAVAA